MNPVAGTAMTVVAAPLVVSSLYLLGLTLLSGEQTPPQRSRRKLRFDIVIPAHDEQAGIASAVRSALAVDWPTGLFTVVVVADNCTDSTAEVAADVGATVLVRQDADLRGKGHALAHAFRCRRDSGQADAFVVVDADSRVSPNLLEAVSARLEAGERAVQVHYGVSNPQESWRTRLMTIAMAAFHRVRSRARERLRLSSGVRGNGWAVTRELLDEIPYESFSLAEDLEFGVRLGMRGVRVAYADEASCDGDMVASAAAATSQRRRWEQGRMAILREWTLPLLKRAIGARSALCLDLAMDLLVLPLSYVALNAGLVIGAGLLLGLTGQGFAWASVGAAGMAAIAAYVLRGWQLSGTGPRGLLELLRAPFFLAWKVVVVLGGRRTTEWVRTSRERV